MMEEAHGSEQRAVLRDSREVLARGAVPQERWPPFDSLYSVFFGFQK